MEYNVRQVNNFITEYPNDERLQKDKDVTLAVNARYPSLVSYTDPELLKDKEVALAAVSRDGRNLRFLCDELRADEDVVLAAVKNFRSSYSYALGKARESREVALAVAAVGGDTISMLDEKFLDDEKIAAAAVGRNPKSIAYFSRRVRALPEIALLALKQDRTVLPHIPDEAFDNDDVFFATIRLTDGKVGGGVLSAATPAGVYRRICDKGLKFNFPLQNIDLLALDGERLGYVLESGLGVTGKKAELFHKFVNADDRDAVIMLLKKNIPSQKTVLSELDFASKNKKFRVLPTLISAGREIRKNESPESDERKLLLRNLRRNSSNAVAKFVANPEAYASDEEVVKLAAAVDGSVLTVLGKTNFAADKELVTSCLKRYVVKNSEEPLLSRTEGVDFDYEQCLIACRRDGRNYFFIPEQFRSDERLKQIAYENGAERYKK